MEKAETPGSILWTISKAVYVVVAAFLIGKGFWDAANEIQVLGVPWYWWHGAGLVMFGIAVIKVMRDYRAELVERDERIAELYQGRPVVKKENREAERALAAPLRARRDEILAITPGTELSVLESRQEMVVRLLHQLGGKHWKNPPEGWETVAAPATHEWAGLYAVMVRRYPGFITGPERLWYRDGREHGRAMTALERASSAELVSLLFREVEYPGEYQAQPDEPNLYVAVVKDLNMRGAASQAVRDRLTSCPWTLVYEPKTGKSSPIRFAESGAITGGNSNETSWQLSADDELEVLRGDGTVHNRFRLNLSDSRYLSTDDPATYAVGKNRIKGQYIHPT